MAFRPTVHGWPFGVLPSPDPSSQGLGASPDPDPGLAGGMCWAALDRYLRGVRIDRSLSRPEPGDALHAELVRRQAAAVAGSWARVREWQERPEESWRTGVPVRVPGGDDVSSRTRRRWRSVRRRLDAGEPVLLVLLLDVDGYRRPTAALHVLATAWRRTGSRVTLSVYDPAHPDVDDLKLAFSLTGPLDALLAGSRRVRGFFDVPYDRATPLAVRAETFEDRSVIGLNRKVKGGLAPVAHDRGVAVIARDRDGALLHFRRARGRSWEGVNVTDRHELGSFELHSDPVAAAAGRSLHVFALGYVGDLLHFRLGRRWKVANVTDQRRVGARFRLATDPVVAVGPLRRISVLGADGDGGLVHYDGRPLLGWRAEQVPGAPIVGSPVAAWRENVLHVLAVSPDGHLLHWQRSGEDWTADDLTDLAGGPSLHVAGRPALHSGADGMTVAAVDPNGRLVAFRNEGHGWSAAVLAEGIAGSPVCATGPGGLHLFALRQGGGLVHAWNPRSWRSENVLAARPALPDVPVAGEIAAWGSERELRVYGRGDDDLWLMAWRPDADWTVEKLGDRQGLGDRYRPGDDPVLVEDRDGRPHVFFTDGRGTVQHVELSDGREPRARRRAASAPAGPLLPVEDEPEAEIPFEEVAPETFVVEEAAAEAPTLDEPAPDSGDEAEPAEVGAEAEVEVELEAEVEAEAEAPEAPEAPPAPVRYWPEDSEPVVEVPVSGSGTAGAADESKEPAIEPMDLSLLDSWPPAPPSLRRRKRSRADGEEEGRREAS